MTMNLQHLLLFLAVGGAGFAIAAGQADLRGATRPARQAATNPIFPYFYEKFDGHEARLKELGYRPTPFLLTKLDFTKDTPYDLQNVEKWLRVMAKSAPGFVFVKIEPLRDAKDEDAAVDIIRQTADKARDAGFTIVLYPYFGSHVESAEKALPIVRKIDRPNVGLTLHLPQEIKGGNARRFPEIIGRVKDHIKLVVICGADMPGEDDNVGKWPWSRLIRPMGEGNFDVRQFVRAVRAAGYDGCFAQICWGIEKPAMEYLPKSMEAWKDCLAP